MDHAPLHDYINRHVQLNHAEAAAVAEAFRVFDYPAGTLLQESGRVPRYLYFVLEGYLRLFYYDERGGEVTSRISRPGDFITPFLQFTHFRPARVSTATITDARVLRIGQEGLQRLIASYPRFQQFSLIIFQEAIESIERRADELATRTARQRYERLLATAPDIVQRVPLQHIASYLGMQPESLSRIRRELTS